MDYPVSPPTYPDWMPDLFPEVEDAVLALSKDDYLKADESTPLQCPDEHQHPSIGSNKVSLYHGNHPSCREIQHWIGEYLIQSTGHSRDRLTNFLAIQLRSSQYEAVPAASLNVHLTTCKHGCADLWKNRQPEPHIPEKRKQSLFTVEECAKLQRWMRDVKEQTTCENNSQVIEKIYLKTIEHGPERSWVSLYSHAQSCRRGCKRAMNAASGLRRPVRAVRAPSPHPKPRPPARAKKPIRASHIDPSAIIPSGLVRSRRTVAEIFPYHLLLDSSDSDSELDDEPTPQVSLPKIVQPAPVIRSVEHHQATPIIDASQIQWECSESLSSEDEAD